MWRVWEKVYPKREMKRHEKCVHLKIKDHECSDCPATFSTKVGLIRHEKKVDTTKEGKLIQLNA